MSNGVATRVRSGLWFRIVVAALSVLLTLMSSQQRGQAQAADALPFSKGFLVTGNYVVGGVDLDPQASRSRLHHRHDPDERRAGERGSPRGVSLLGNDLDERRAGERRAIPRFTGHGRQGVVARRSSRQRLRAGARAAAAAPATP